MTCVFLVITNKWLKHNSDSSNAVNAIMETVRVSNGDGSYFNLHTGRYGFGTKANGDTMAIYLKRYGVTKDIFTHYL